MKRIDELGISRMPWNTEDGRVWNCDGWLVYDAPYRTESMMPYQQSNARLISAAPELYECLIESIECVCAGCPRNPCESPCEVVAKWRAALAKAAGEESAL